MCSLTARQSWRLSYFYAEIFPDNRAQYEKSQFDFLGVRCLGAQRLLYSGLQFAEQKFAEVSREKAWGRISDV